MIQVDTAAGTNMNTFVFCLAKVFWQIFYEKDYNKQNRSSVEGSARMTSECLCPD